MYASAVIVRLTDALHARPANLLVRLASKFAGDVSLRKGERHANGKNILEVLGLAAARGEEIEIEAHGDGADDVLAALAHLIERCFDSDLVPEGGTAGAAGIAVGAAVVAAVIDVSRAEVRGSLADERVRVSQAIAGALRDVEALTRGLRPREAELFLPELEILRALEPLILARLEGGESAEAAVIVEASSDASDLLLDAKTRLLEGLSGGNDRTLADAFAAHAGRDVVLVTEALAPSLVASLPPHVVGILVGFDPEPGNAGTPRGTGYTSHAAILARGREIPLAFVPSHVVAAIGDGDLIVLDTTGEGARVWVAPSEALAESARARREAHARERASEPDAPIAHLRGVAVRTNIGTIHDEVPRGAEGIGLFRTELAFAGRRVAPAEAEQLATVSTVSRRAGGAPVVVRLFDAGGDKPLAWLAPPSHAPHARGIELLLFYADVLDAQLRALVRARRQGADIRVLLPLVRSATDVEDVRARSNGELPVGAMIETPEAVADVDSIAAAAEFVCIGTNDLTALALGLDRADASLSLDARALTLVARTVDGAHARDRRVTVCGEIAANERGARILVGLGVDALSVAPPFVAVVRRALSSVTLDDCKALARESMRMV